MTVKKLTKMTGDIRFYDVRINGDRYILTEPVSAADVPEITDKTAFEAVTNHVHLKNRVSLFEYLTLKGKLPEICAPLIRRLKEAYPDTTFAVSADITLHGSLTVRFHQRHEGESGYAASSYPGHTTTITVFTD